MSAQPAVLQVVILRDGLLLGTEVFVPGRYIIGSGDGADLKLDDASIQSEHAFLYFQNGRAAIQDAGSGAVFVNGHRVNACEVRSVDEVTCGPFSLKVRVMAQAPKGASKNAPPPEVAALLGNPEPPARPPAPATARPTASPPVKPAAVPATVVSARRMTAAPQASAAAPVAKAAPHLKAVEPLPLDEEQTRTESINISDLHSPTMPARPTALDPQKTMPLPSAKAAAPVRSAPPAVVVEPGAVTVPEQAVPKAAPPPKPAAAPAPAAKAAAAAAPPPKKKVAKSPKAVPSLPGASDGKGRPHLFFEVYWGETRRYAKSFKTIDKKKKLIASEDDAAAMPLYGFGLNGENFLLADQVGPDVFRVFVPKNAAVERKAQDGNFYPVQPDSLEAAAPGQPCVTLGNGHALRLTGADEMTVVAYVQPAIPKPFANPLAGLPWLVLINLALFGGAFLSFVALYAKLPEEADFQGRKVNPVAVRLIAPPKPEEKKKIEEKLAKVKPKEKKKEEPTKIEKAIPKQVTQETKKALKSVEKLMAAGPAMKDLLAAVDKLGSGPGKKDSKMKLSDLVGKQPIAAAGIGNFGLGGGGAGGMGIKGAELLRGKGGAGIGALGAGNIGKGAVGGTVTHAVARSVQAQGTIDKDAVAKVINSHLHEVSSCYERALLKEAGLAGKIVLEWNISTAGIVTFAKTKSSTMKSAAVETCILTALKGWKFPPAQGAGVVISYPFMFNSVGY